MLALTGKARLWEPRRLRLRLFTTTGQFVTTGRRRILRLARHWPWTSHRLRTPGSASRSGQVGRSGFRRPMPGSSIPTRRAR
ncbi:hypothetical protein F558DRAFT_03717 [Streptomyces sp. AmelKG-A3]|nr:hypothetical protein GA0115247_114421 [Streptomyces sp. PalvLS-984]SDD26452.1 hypothetical protein F558DRAFT_03717 [Streptomyces sp. AmelKG-A3]